MKKAVMAVVVILVGLLSYNYATTGEVKLIPSFSLSAEEQSVKDLKAQFEAAKRRYSQALRSAGLGGVDTTADVEAARRSAKELERELATLRKRLTDDRAIRNAEELVELVRTFALELR